jgi:hypothetical protein
MAKTPVPSLASVQVTAPTETAPVAAPPPTIQRESLHVRLPIETVERVREAAHRLRRERQEIADEALREWLTARGF